ncbi:MAG: endonuclease [Bacteroidaceae bacterium]|nr:endonuclease [Bacteroidaceae bacterium]
MHRYLCIVILSIISLAVKADPTKTYYSNVNGLVGDALKTTLKAIVNDHNYIDYSLLDDKYPSIYTLTDRGTDYVYDIFSPELYTYANGGFNKEHVVPKSWWGGKQDIDCFHDIISVIPAHSAANQKKSNFPPGIVKTANYDNGRLRVGTPTNGLGTSFSWVFEPYDEFKGDFARIYMYVAMCYDDAPWAEGEGASEFTAETWPTMSEWLYKLLLKWHNDDPVSEMERIVNDRIYAVQGNRNPFIDYPVLADYIWGDWRGTAFVLADAILYQHSTIRYPGTVNGTSTEMPIALSATTIPCYSVAVGETVTKTIDVRLANLDSDVSVSATIGTVTPTTIAASASTATLTWTYSSTEIGSFDGMVTLTSGSNTAYTRIYGSVYDPTPQTGDGVIWELVTKAEDLVEGDEYLLTSRKNGCVAGVLNSGYLTRIISDKLSSTTSSFTDTPDGALVLTLGSSGNYFTFANREGKLLGSMSSLNLSFGNSNASKTWTISINNSTHDITIANTSSNCGTIYYNSGTPRFKTYTSTNQVLPQLFHKTGQATIHTLTWMVGEELYATTTAINGQPLSFPAISPSFDGYTFMGWTPAENVSDDGSDITYVTSSNKAMSSATYHAVFAKASGGENTSEELLSENFGSVTTGNNTSTGGSNVAWAGNNVFPTVKNAYNAGGSVRIGKSGESGSITSRTLNATAGSEVTVTFDVKGWTSVEGNIIVTLGSTTQTVSYTATMSSSTYDTKSVIIQLTDDNPTLTLSTSAKRAFIDNVSVFITRSPIIYSSFTLNPEAQNLPEGDINEDGNVDVSDVTALVAHILGSTQHEAAACDINGDGEVNVSDVTALVAIILATQ